MRSMRSSRALLPPALFLALSCASGCLEPFPERGTTPTKKRATAGTGRGSGSKAGKAAKKGAKKQSYREAWQLICDAERRSGTDPALPLAQRGERVANWIAVHVTNKRARYWWIAYGKVKREEREAMFRREAKQAGFPRCPLVKLLFAKPQSAPSAGQR